MGYDSSNRHDTSRENRRVKATILSLAAGFGLLATANLPAAEQARAAEKPNVLFIAVDDLNHWVGYLGRNAQTATPNIDRLAARPQLARTRSSTSRTTTCGSRTRTAPASTR